MTDKVFGAVIGAACIVVLIFVFNLGGGFCIGSVGASCQDFGSFKVAERLYDCKLRGSP